MNTRVSAASITIRRRTLVLNPNDELFDGLRRLMDDCGPNKHDQAVAVITACIGQGINIVPRLTGIGRQLGFNGRHFGMTLNHATGCDPARHRWSRDNAGVYTLFD